MLMLQQTQSLIDTETSSVTMNSLNSATVVNTLATILASMKLLEMKFKL